MGLFLRKNHLLRCWGWISLLNWIGAVILSLLLKLPPRKLEPWFVLWSFFLLRLLCMSINLPYGCIEYCCHVWAGAPRCYLEFLDKVQKRICRTVGPSLIIKLKFIFVNINLNTRAKSQYKDTWKPEFFRLIYHQRTFSKTRKFVPDRFNNNKEKQ